MVKLLLANEANPSAKTFLGHSALDLAADLRILSYLKKGYLLTLANRFLDRAEKKEVWKREALAYFTTDDDNGIPFLM